MDKSKILQNLERRPNTVLQLSRLAARFLVGPTAEPTPQQFEVFADMMMEGDPLADRLAAAFGEMGMGPGMQMLNQALKSGINTVKEAPQELRDLFSQVDNDPVWLDRDMVAAGQTAVQRSGLWAPYILGDVALVGGYVIMGSMNKSLVATGALEKGGSAKRLFETYQWFLAVSETGGMDRFKAGFESTIKVRVMHSLVRRSLSRRSDWQTDQWGIPVSQGHMAATLQAFGAAFITMARAMGIHYSAHERASMMHMWRYVGWLMGIKEEYCYTNEADALRVIYLSARTSPPIDDDAVKLANGYFESEYDFSFLDNYRLGWLGQALSKFSTGTRLGMIRMAVGNADYQALGLPGSPAWVAFPLAMAGATHLLSAATAFIPGSKDMAASWGRRIHEAILQLTAEELRTSKPAFVPYDKRADLQAV